MTIHLFAQRNRATSITTIAVLGLMALLVAPSTPARAADERPTPVLAEGAGMGVHPSAHVRLVQRALDRRGYDLGAPGVDGRFGPITAAAVRHVQADRGLAVDGIVGGHTRKALRLAWRAVDRQRRSDVDHRSKTGRERTPTAQAVPSRSRAGVTTVRKASMELSSGTSGGWIAVLLAGALGAVITLVLTMAVGAWRRGRDRAPSTTSLFADGVDARIGGPTAAPQKMQISHNHNGDAAALSSQSSSEIRPSGVPPRHGLIGYVTVPAKRGAGDAARSSEAITALCARRGWDLLEIVHDREVGRTLERPALGYALGRIARRQADGLVVGDLQRLSRSIVDLGALMAWFRDAQARLIALDLSIDTSTPQGRRVASTLIALSDHASERIAHRGRNGSVTDVRAEPRAGRPSVRHDPELLERIATMRAQKMTLQAIADLLNAEGVPTLRGGTKWRPSSIQTALGYRRPSPREHLPSLDERSART